MVVGLVGEADPRVIGRYAVYGEIASGGMASVHFARQVGPSGFSRTVAIKRAHPHLARDPDFALMFLDEARLASRIRHSNVVSTIDVLNTPNELVLVMDYVHGESLWKLARTTSEKKERIPAPIAATILIDTLHGLHAAHEAKDERGEPLGIVHRDVSPHNILVGVDGITRLVDFGIAKAAGRLHTTRDSSVKGKSAYMAPEQVRGEAVSRLTDTYAASIVFWELLTGERLFVGKTEAETIHKCLVGRVQPPSLFAPELGTKLDEILRKGLSRDPSRRYQTAREMALDLEACMPAIRPSEVGSWVERVAGASLAARGEILAKIEHGDFEDSPPARSGVAAVAALPTPGSMQTVVVGRGRMEGEGTPGSARTLAPLVESQPHASPRKAAFLAALLVALLGTVGALFVVLRQKTPSVSPLETAATSAPASTGAPALTPLPPLAPTPPATGAPASLAPVPAPPPPAALPEVVARPASVVPAPRPSLRGGSRSSHAKRGACDPPYSVDAEGRQIFKPECM
jgi:serine/threonine protein kinase